MWPQLLNMLTWEWLILAAVPPAIVALYFLKLKRRPVEVPSTYLWRRSIEDLHVNSIWQRLRRNLLLFLQLLLILLAMLAVLRPAWRGTELPGDRFIFLVDNSASMQATDVAQKKARLEEAKRRGRELIEQMDPGDAAMIVSFADTARVEQMFTEDRRQLLRSLERIEPTCRGTSVGEALKVASGLANPGRAAYETSDVQVAEAMPATLLVISDGKFEPLSSFALGNLSPMYLPVGSAAALNVGIVALAVRRHELKADQWQAFARLENFGGDEIPVTLELSLDGQMIDADQMTVGGGETRGVVFDLGMIDSGVLRLAAQTGDDLPLDDVAWTIVSPPRRARVLLVTDGNEPLELALGTSAATELAEVTIQAPDFLKKPEYQQQAAAGAFDLVIFDRCLPEAMPQANTLFIGSLPLAAAVVENSWKAKPKVSLPQIIDIDPAHPLLKWLDLGDVTIVEGTPLEPPPGGTVLVDSHAGPMFGIAPREGFEDAVLGFGLIDEQADADGNVERYVGTNWPIRASFPAFVLNVVEYLGGGQSGLESGNVRPGEPVALESPRPDKPLVVKTPGGKRVKLDAVPGGQFSFVGTSELGVYEVELDGKPLRQFAVNLFKPGESNIRPAVDVGIGPLPVAAQASGWESTRREIWKSLLLLGLVVLSLEWYIFSRRVSM
jgi:hypothetical protein